MNEPGTWIAMGTMAISALAAFGAAVIGWRKDRDKLQNEARVVALEITVKVQGEKLEAQATEIEQLREAEANCKRELYELYRYIGGHRPAAGGPPP